MFIDGLTREGSCHLFSAKENLILSKPR